jgi:hypothetical protein
MKSILNTLFALAFSCGILSAQSWRDIKTTDDLCKAQPATIQAMLDEFDLETRGLEKVKAAYQSGNLAEACAALLTYYKNGNTAEYLRMVQPEKSPRTVAEADTTLKNVFIIQNVRGQVPWLEDGHRDWYYKGPNNDREWAWLSNRHKQLLEVFHAYRDTGNPKYAIYIDEFLRDFIIKSMPYPATKSKGSIWRGIEVARRAQVWSEVFYGLLNCEYINDATFLLMLCSLPDHAHYNRNFHTRNNSNILTMEISSLAAVATNWPQYKESEEWMNYAVKTMSESMKIQVYPDGVQTELTSHYHNVALRSFELFKEICDRAEYQLPDFFNETLEAMYSYMAHTVRPDGHRILNNDGDRGSDIELILEGAEKYNHPEWVYIATNGKEGATPLDGPSYFYPWAGQLISRNGFDRDAHWSFLDVGPWGSGHQHNDKLHISISAFGRDLLVDAGRFAYTGAVADKFQPYARGTQGHNSVLIDGKGQMPGVRITDEPLSEDHWKITPEFDYAWNSFDKYYDVEDVEHNRSVMYVRGAFWLIVDKIETRQTRKIETLWHWHPECKVKLSKNGTISTKNKKGNLKVAPIGKTNWEVDMIKGQEEPEVRGWYSEEYNVYEPNIEVVHATTVNGREAFVWLLVPSEKKAPKLKVGVTSKNDDGIQLRISGKKNGTWKLTIPYSDSDKVQVEYSK